MIGDNSDTVWGVMDSIPRTNFPDIREITVMRSAVGSALNVTGEGGSMHRFYMELPRGTAAEDVKLDIL